MAKARIAVFVLGAVVLIPALAGAQTLPFEYRALLDIDENPIEPDETFMMNLANPINAVIADGQGTCTITNDDTPPD